MNTALHNEKLVNLVKYQREIYQFLYEEGKKGRLTCPACLEPVRLYLGIQDEPHFFHISNRPSTCQDKLSIQKPIEIIESSKELNGFQIPKSRTITVVQEQTTSFKKAKSVKAPPPFQPTSVEQANLQASYLQKLANDGTFLDEHQSNAVTAVNGPLLVLAGAGSGKTRVLTARTAYMLNEHRIKGNEMMLVTFTAKAANEMKMRLLQYPDMNQQMVKQLVTGTFHSIFYRILSFHQPEQYSSEKLLKKDWQREQILKEAGRELKLDEKEFAYDLALQQIGLWKNSLIAPNHVHAKTPWEEKVAFLYQYYENFKQKQRLFDFDDMLIGCYQLFTEQPQLLSIYHNRLHYFLIDEFQDINKVQYELMKLLSSKSNNICAVGDDDQSIYAFRGSDPHYLLDFEQDFPTAKVVILDQNYRSNHPIVATANAIIKKNKQRRAKSMIAQYDRDHAPIFFYPFDEEEEATMILTDILEKMEAGASPEDFAILYRTHTGSRAIFERFVHSSLPFTIDQDAESFYDRFIVKSMLGFLKLSLNEDDQESIKQILPALFVKQSVLQDLKAESILQDCTLLECLPQIKTGFAFQESKLKRVLQITRTLASLSPVVAIEKVEKELGFQDFIKKRGNEGNQMDKGSDDIRDLKVAAKRFQTLYEFLEHVDHMRAMNREIKALSKDRQHAVTLSTIHRAKGLEYKTVYILGAVDGSIPHDYALDAYRNGDEGPLEEERRLLYVAMTRAQEHLYLSVPEKRRGKTANSSRFLQPIR
ncbi:UvrD-helicase domain-containing protein [Cytobacillus spongiae]|uniref:UvrD-helicase domain-containing protein n=1 Tax=Cytobacillus spongiae TaxID=2901381 RepID=UPI001F1CDCB6|nr:ATP-dependent helicase [Cytobacillus spongiae]UII57050.1 UvrD-helicase domain-containing protein [Cytobacillus spongiae]